MTLKQFFFTGTVTCFYFRTFPVLHELPEFSEFEWIPIRVEEKCKQFVKFSNFFFFQVSKFQFRIEFTFGIIYFCLDYLLENWNANFIHFNNLIYVNIGIKVSCFSSHQTNGKLCREKTKM